MEEGAISTNRRSCLCCGLIIAILCTLECGLAVSAPAGPWTEIITTSQGGTIPAAGSTFYFAEGYTGSGFQEYLCLGNSGDDPIEVEVTFLLGGGGTQIEIYEVPALSRFTADVNAAVGAGQGGPVNKSYSVPANGRTTVYVNGPEGVGSNKNVSVHLSSTNYFLAERPMYFNFGGVWTGGHDVVGYTP